MNIFQTFLRATKQATCGNDSIYVGDVTPELLDSYIAWRREVKQNTDATINHSLTPILKACAYACEMNIMEPAINARIQDMRIITKTSLSEEESEFDGKSLNKEQMQALMEYYKTCQEPRRKEFLEMFFFAFHACGLRVVDVMTLQWGHVNFEKKELRKIMIKTNKRHVIPLTEPAIHILRQWQEKREGCRYVFNLVKENLELDDEEALYKAFEGAGIRLPKHKQIIMTLADKDKQDGIDIAQRFEALGYKIYASRGTAKVLKENGVHAIQVNKIGQEAPTLLDLILEHKIDLVIDTPENGIERARDGFLIRRYAIETGVHCLTSLDTAHALISSLEHAFNNQELSIVDIAKIDNRGK